MTAAAFKLADIDESGRPDGASGRAERELTAGGPQLDFGLVQDFDGLVALERDWSELFVAHARPEQVFQAHDWCRIWCRHYLPAAGAKGPRLAILTGRLHGRLVLVWPMVVEHRAGLKALAFLGDPVSQYGDALTSPEARSPATIAAAWRHLVLATGADLAFLRKVRADSPLHAGLAVLGGRIIASDEAPYVDISQVSFDKDGTPQLANRRRAKNRRRQMRRLQELGTVEMVAIPPGSEAAAAAAEAIRLKRDWLDRKGQVSRAFADPRLVAFFAEASAASGTSTGCVVSTLRTNGEIAALQIEIACKDQRFLHISVYAQAFEKLGAGGLLLEHCLHDAAQAGATRYDLLPPRYDYKIEFCDGVVMVHDHALALTLAGRIYCDGILSLRRRAKRVVERLPPSVRRAIAGLMDLRHRRSQAHEPRA